MFNFIHFDSCVIYSMNDAHAKLRFDTTKRERNQLYRESETNITVTSVWRRTAGGG